MSAEVERDISGLLLDVADCVLVAWQTRCGPNSTDISLPDQP